MATAPEVRRLVRFDGFEMDLAAGELRKKGKKRRLQDQAFRILEHLALHAKQAVLREELYSYLPAHGSYDLKHGLDNALVRIRRALGDSAENSRFIETLRGRGYRFLRQVEVIPPVCSQSDCTDASLPDSFLSAVKQIRAEYIAAIALQELTALFHRLSCLLDQNRAHPNRSEGLVLLESIQNVRSQQNAVKQRISFETANLVFEDPWALSVPRSSISDGLTWDTLGRVQQTKRLRRRAAVLLVSHEVRESKKRILFARKATALERAVYDRTRKKTN